MQVNFEEALEVSVNVKTSENLDKFSEPKYTRTLKETNICYQSSCNYENNNNKSLKIHERSHKDYSNKIFCEYCKFGTTRKTYYSKHLLSEHPEIKLNVGVEQCN